MTDASALVPASTLRVQMQGLAILGLDMQRLHARIGPLPEPHDALIPVQSYWDMWDEAQDLYGLPGLPTALAMAIPFGAFGALDYLVGSSDTISGCCESAQLHFSMAASDVRLEHDALEDGTHVVRARGSAGLPAVVVEFAIASVLSRLRYVSDGRFQPMRVSLPIPKPASDPVRARLYGSLLAYGFPCAEILIDAKTWLSETTSADPYLHATLTQVAHQLKLTQPGDSTLEQALRARLRGALAQRQAEPERLAALLGVSERTLQRRLAEKGRSFSEVLEDFRREESARLLCERGLHLAQVASRLGYSEQTSFTRAFRRWTGTTPGAWRAKQLAGATGT
jgi:AraC-like DNA-binding protein